MAQEPDFKMEKNILEKIAENMGFKLWFLPKFHCELNWAELYWCTFKTFVRSKIDGKLRTMHRALWEAYSGDNIPLVLARRFSRKVRELIYLYLYKLDGMFAVYCQKAFNGHRMSFINAEALKPWKIGSKATCPQKEGGKRRMFCTIEDIDMVKQVCTVTFGRLKRANVLLSDLRPVSEKAQIHNM